MKASEVLDKAADIVVRDGWIQGQYYREADLVGVGDDDGYLERDAEAKKSAPCCQAGAVCRALFGVAWRPYGMGDYNAQLARGRAEFFMQRYVKDVFGADSAIEWNDRATTTAEDVTAALRGAAELAREAGE